MHGTKNRRVCFRSVASRWIYWKAGGYQIEMLFQRQQRALINCMCNEIRCHSFDLSYVIVCIQRWLLINLCLECLFTWITNHSREMNGEKILFTLNLDETTNFINKSRLIERKNLPPKSIVDEFHSLFGLVNVTWQRNWKKIKATVNSFLQNWKKIKATVNSFLQNWTGLN